MWKTFLALVGIAATVAYGQSAKDAIHPVACDQLATVPVSTSIFESFLAGELQADLHGCLETSPPTVYLSTALYDAEFAADLARFAIPELGLRNMQVLIDIRPSVNAPASERVTFLVADGEIAVEGTRQLVSQEPARIPRTLDLTPDDTIATDLGRFAAAMFGHLGAVQRQCPPEFADLSSQVLCATYDRPFQSFMRDWDLHADWSDRVPFVPQPVTAWNDLGDGVYARSYDGQAGGFMVTYVSSNGGGMIVILD